MQPKGLKFYFVNSASFHPKSYKSLYAFMKTHKIPHYFNTEKIEWMKCFGDYEGFAAELVHHFDAIQNLNKKELKGLTYKKADVFGCTRAELLSYLLTRPEWYSNHVPVNEDELFDLIWERNKKELLLNMAAAMYWLDFWSANKDLNESYTHAFMFSGSSIYTKALGSILNSRDTLPVLVEHFFTGLDYYCEQKSEPLANGSDLKYDTIYNSYKIPSDFKSFQEEKNGAISKIIEMRNKNVSQPKNKDILKDKFCKKSKIVLILGQVINDFSLIETANENLNSIDLYKKIIKGVLDNTDYNIVFKAHPWERRKANTKGEPITLNEIYNFRNLLTDSEADRFFLTEDYNIYNLFAEVDFVTAICSQGAIEAAYYGFKPVMFGNPFFGKRGFTYDCSNTDEAIQVISTTKSGLLSLNEFKLFENFLIIALQKHLVSVHDSGIFTLERKFNIERDYSKKYFSDKKKIKYRKKRKIISLEDFKAKKIKRRAQKFLYSTREYCEDSRFAVIRYFARFYK